MNKKVLAITVAALIAQGATSLEAKANTVVDGNKNYAKALGVNSVSGQVHYCPLKIAKCSLK